jgi:hypothetical protein
LGPGSRSRRYQATIGEEVFSSSVKVDGNVERTFKAKAFRASFFLKDYDREPITASSLCR